LGLGDEAVEAMGGLGLFASAGKQFRPPAPKVGQMRVLGRHPPSGFASPYDLEPTDAPGAGMIGLRQIAKIRRNMRRDGYNGFPVVVVLHDGKKYVVNGNHRMRASEGILDEIPYRVVELPFGGFNKIDHVLEGWNLSRRLLPRWMAQRALIRAGG
jgi:hypothetical protein